jgi:hypothetical protein
LKTCRLKTCAGLAVLAAVVLAGVATTQSSAQGRKIGEISNLHAWINRMPPRVASINATGMITAPNPCYDALAEFTGVDKSNPSIHLVKITLQEDHGFCIQVFTDIPFSYQRWNYAGRAAKITIFSESDSKTIPVEVAY